ncbi:orotate phosphoribosyltransferase [Chitinophagales bacterium]|nr:orotate phosphoribosyltransferase [Chitinophagales bacterium]
MNTIQSEQLATKIATQLLEIKAIKLSPENHFQWSAGWNSPIYCDNRKSLSYPALRSTIASGLAQLIQDKFPEASAISGVATAGIAHGALAANELELPFSYVRSKAKGHGLQNQIEGEIAQGAKVVMVEDLISSGKSTLEAIEALHQQDIEVLGTVAIFTYGFQHASDSFTEKKQAFYTLLDYQKLIEIAVEKHYVNSDQLASLQEWRQAPEKWKK